MRYKKINPDLFTRNRWKLVQRLEPDSLVIVNSNDEMPRSGDQNFSFRQNPDLFYLTGLDQEKCILAICPDHPIEQMREIVFTLQTNETMVIWNGHKYTREQASEVSGVKNVKWLDEFETVLKDLMQRSENVYLNLNENPRYSTEVPYKDLRFADKLKKDFPLHNFRRLYPLMTELRLVKEPEEIELIREACNITGKAFNRILKFVKPGLMEYEVEAEIIHEFIRNGACGHSFAPIVANAENACVLHYVKNDMPLQDGELVLIDYGAEYANYAADCTRTIPVNGQFTPRQKEVYNAVLRVMKKATSLMIPGTTIDKFHKEVCVIIEKEMIGLGLFTEEDVKNQKSESPMFFKYFMHGTGHFLGLDVHDIGTRQQILKKGMILTCEPGIYIPEENMGIRLENDIMVDEKPVDLMADIPIEADEIEKLMKR